VGGPGTNSPSDDRKSLKRELARVGWKGEKLESRGEQKSLVFKLCSVQPTKGVFGGKKTLLGEKKGEGVDKKGSKTLVARSVV